MHAHTCDVCSGTSQKVLDNLSPDLWPRDWWINDSGIFVADCWDCRGTGVVECDYPECAAEEWPDCDLEVA